MIFTIAAITDFVTENLAIYIFNKGLDKVSSIKADLIIELRKLINSTLDDYEKLYPVQGSNDKYPFYNSQRIIDELLKYRVMHADDYNADELFSALKSEPNVIPPTKQDIENFYGLFINKLKGNDKLKALDIKENFQSEIFNVSRKLDDLGRNIENILLSFSADLELQWKSRIDTYSVTIQRFKPATALILLEALTKSLSESNKQPTPEFLSLIAYQKGLCYSFKNDLDATCKAHIAAYKLNPRNSIFKEQAAMAYLKLKENPTAEILADELIASDEFNAIAWAIKIINADVQGFQSVFTTVPSVVKRDILWRKTLFLNFQRNKRADLMKLLFHNNLVPLAADYRKTPVTIDTYSEHVFWMNVAINEYFSNFFMNFYEIDQSNIEIITLLNSLIGDFLRTIKGTEIDNGYEELHFLYAYTNFIITKESKYAFEMKDLFPTIPNKDYLNIMLCTNSLQLSGHNEAAIEILEAESSNATELLLLQAYCYFHAHDVPKYATTIKKFLAATKQVPSGLLASYLNIIVQLRAWNYLEIFTEAEFLSEKVFETPDEQKLVETFVKLAFNGQSDQLVQVLTTVAPEFSDPTVAGMIGDIYHMVGLHNLTVSHFRGFLDFNSQSRELLYYIYSLFHTKKDTKELLELLEKWRLNFDFHSGFLKAELQFRLQRSEWPECIEICEFYLKTEPDDEHVTVNYAVALFQDNSVSSKATLAAIATKLQDFPYSTIDHVKIVANILMKRKFFDEGIELFYRYAQLKENKVLRKDYFMACVQASQGAANTGPLKEFDEAVEGVFIKYELDHKIFFIELTPKNLKEAFFQNFLGARTGGAVIVKQHFTGAEDLLYIQRIMNKYLWLHDEITEELNTNPYSQIPMTSVKFEESTPESLNQTLQKMFGADGTSRQRVIEQNYQEYYDRKLSLTELITNVFQGDYLSGYFHLCSQKEGITQIPLVFLKCNITSGTEYVIDMSSLMIIYQIYKRYSVNLPDKFIISRYIVDAIKQKLDAQGLEARSPMSLSVTADKVIPHFEGEEVQGNNITYLMGLLKWIEKNCLVELSDRVLDFTRNMEILVGDKPFIDYTLNTILLLEDKPNRLLLTDDSMYSKLKLIDWTKICSSELYIKNSLGDDHDALFEFIRNKYLGFTPSLSQLNGEYIKKLTSQTNTYNTCLENLNLWNNPNSLTPGVQHVKEIALNQVISQEQMKNDITTVFVHLLPGMAVAIRPDLKILIQLECRLLGHKIELIIAALEDAYLILDGIV